MVAHQFDTVRTMMAEEHLAAVVMTNGSPHGKDCDIARWKEVEWLSGIVDLTAVAVVTARGGMVWTASHLLQEVRDELGDAGVMVTENAVAGVGDVARWIVSTLNGSSVTEVAANGSCMSKRYVDELIALLRQGGGLTLRSNIDFMGRLSAQRPSLPSVVEERRKDNELTTSEKLRRLRRALIRQSADGQLVVDGSEVAWLLNLRDHDATGKVLFCGFLLVDSQKATFFVGDGNVDCVVESRLAADGVDVASYGDMAKSLRSYLEYNILLDPEQTPYNIYNKVERPIVNLSSPVPLLMNE